jgi:hypothetical protein
MNSKDLIASRGYLLVSIELPANLRQAVEHRDWVLVDELIRKEATPGGVIFKEMRKYTDFSEIEFIISIRSSRVEPDEDGIWHDDGSRVLAFSLSLTLDHEGVEGGRLEVRRRDRQGTLYSSEFVPTPPYGTMIVFATGLMDFEHKINKVTQGERVIIAGWCT